MDHHVIGYYTAWGTDHKGYTPACIPAGNLLPISNRYWHKEAKVPWLYHPDGEIFISYDDPESLKWKANYVKEHDLKGVMFWELSGDDAESSLIDALVEGLK